MNLINMTIKNFDDWLEEYFLDVEPTTTKDNFEDMFDRWISQLNYDDYVRLANLFGDYRAIMATK